MSGLLLQMLVRSESALAGDFVPSARKQTFWPASPHVRRS